MSTQRSFLIHTEQGQDMIRGDLQIRAAATEVLVCGVMPGSKYAVVDQHISLSDVRSANMDLAREVCVRAIRDLVTELHTSFRGVKPAIMITDHEHGKRSHYIAIKAIKAERRAKRWKALAIDMKDNRERGRFLP